jgi:hypothetical protein
MFMYFHHKKIVLVIIVVLNVQENLRRHIPRLSVEKRLVLMFSAEFVGKHFTGKNGAIKDFVQKSVLEQADCIEEGRKRE